MKCPPSIQTLLPSLTKEGERYTILLRDLERLLSSLSISDNGVAISSEAEMSLSVTDLRKIIKVALCNVEVNEDWYFTQVPALEHDVKSGLYNSPAEHYFIHGYLEGRQPDRPEVDESFYLERYPDVAQALRAGRIASAFEHYINDGYKEGRLPRPSTEGN
jgi:hypothetical protein